MQLFIYRLSLLHRGEEMGLLGKENWSLPLLSPLILPRANSWRRRRWSSTWPGRLALSHVRRHRYALPRRTALAGLAVTLRGRANIVRVAALPPERRVRYSLEGARGARGEREGPASTPLGAPYAPLQLRPARARVIASDRLNTARAVSLTRDKTRPRRRPTRQARLGRPVGPAHARSHRGPQGSLPSRLRARDSIRSP